MFFFTKSKIESDPDMKPVQHDVWGAMNLHLDLEDFLAQLKRMNYLNFLQNVFFSVPTLNHELCINSIHLSKLISRQISIKEILIMDIKYHTSNKYVPSHILMIYLQQIPFDFHRTRQFSAKILLFSFIYKKFEFLNRI